VGITETLLQGDQRWDLNIQGYVSYRKDRQLGRGIGVALFVRYKIKSLARGDIGSNGVCVCRVEESQGEKDTGGSYVQAPEQ